MDTIKSSSEISNLFAVGRRLKTPYLTFIVKEKAKENGACLFMVPTTALLIKTLGAFTAARDEKKEG